MSRNVTCKPGMWGAVTLALVAYSSAIASILYFYSSPYATLAGGFALLSVGVLSFMSFRRPRILHSRRVWSVSAVFVFFLSALFLAFFVLSPGFGVSFSLSFLYGVLLLATSLMSNLLLIGLICVRFPKHLEA